MQTGLMMATAHKCVEATFGSIKIANQGHGNVEDGRA